MPIEFREWPKIARLNREMIVTEKIDGTNACVVIDFTPDPYDRPGRITDNGAGLVVKVKDYAPMIVAAQSRKRVITPESDNFGFARWVREHAQELADGLGIGYHFGEWYGSGIQRSYGLDEKRFMLFNVDRWSENRPDCCEAATTLYRGTFRTDIANALVDKLRDEGSAHVPGFANPEGIVVYHRASNASFKVTCEKDEVPKALIDKGIR
jgi:hypothetical protein